MVNATDIHIRYEHDVGSQSVTSPFVLGTVMQSLTMKSYSASNTWGFGCCSTPLPEGELSKSVEVSGAWVYIDPETGFLSHAPNPKQLMRLLRESDVPVVVAPTDASWEIRGAKSPNFVDFIDTKLKLSSMRLHATPKQCEAILHFLHHSLGLSHDLPVTEVWPRLLAQILILILTLTLTLILTLILTLRFCRFVGGLTVKSSNFP